MAAVTSIRRTHRHIRRNSQHWIEKSSSLMEGAEPPVRLARLSCTRIRIGTQPGLDSCYAYRLQDLNEIILCHRPQRESKPGTGLREECFIAQQSGLKCPVHLTGRRVSCPASNHSPPLVCTNNYLSITTNCFNEQNPPGQQLTRAGQQRWTNILLNNKFLAESWIEN